MSMPHERSRPGEWFKSEIIRRGAARRDGGAAGAAPPLHYAPAMSTEEQIRAARARLRIERARKAALVRRILAISDRAAARAAERPDFSEAHLYDEEGLPG
jgi:hypothetical protein